jgi:HSP20 family molecular chaperone IbpA
VKAPGFETQYISAKCLSNLRKFSRKEKTGMKNENPRQLVRTPEIRSLFAGDPFIEPAQEINDLIARRAHELFESSGFTHGHADDDWLRAESEILLQAPVDVTETETGFTIRADVPGFREKDLEVRAAPRSLCITGKRQESSDQKEGTTIYSERHTKHIFRVVGLSSEIDPDRVNATVSDGLLEIKLLKVGLGKKVPVLAKTATA